jgi:NADH:ubiquinone oxidoreductase subunit 4 (subunit M)
VRRTTDEAPAAWLLLHAGGLLALCALDAGWLLLGWELLLLGACARLRVWLRACRGPAGRWGYVLSTQLGTVLLLGSLWQLWAHSLPTALANGTTVAHSTDLVKLAYLNYFGDLKWAGLRLDRLLWAALTIGTLLPVVLLPLLPAPRIERLWLSLPLLALATATTVRLPFMLLPQATAALGPWLVGLAVAWTVAWTLRALRTAALPQLLSAALTARAGGVFVGLLAMTQTGVHAALLQLWHHGLVVALLALLVPASERRPAYRAGLWGALVLAIDVPGTLGFVQRTLLLLGAFAWSRLAAVVLTVAGLPVAIAALRLHVRRRAARRAPARPRIGREPPTLELAAVVGLAGLATVLGLWTQPLLDLWRGFANDFLSHVCAHLDAGALALLAP